MGIFGGLFGSAMKAVGKVFGLGKNNFADDLSDIEQELLYMEKLAELQTKVSEIMPYAIKADESYRLLLYENLRQVPAVDIYDGEYVEKLESLLAKAESTDKPNKVDKYIIDSTQVATEIQVYLNEETSSLEAAKLWDSKFVKGLHEHIPPHYKKGEYEDDVMSEVMRAFRNWSSFAQAAIDMYGSQRLINATYEAVEEGKDAMDYMSEILDLNERDKSIFGGGLHEKIIVPNAGFFGGGFFF